MSSAAAMNMTPENVNPTYPTDMTPLRTVKNDIKTLFHSMEWRTPTTESLKNEGAGVPYTRRIAINQTLGFDERDKVRISGYFAFGIGAVLYFHPLAGNPTSSHPAMIT